MLVDSLVVLSVCNMIKNNIILGLWFLHFIVHDNHLRTLKNFWSGPSPTLRVSPFDPGNLDVYQVSLAQIWTVADEKFR